MDLLLEGSRLIQSFCAADPSTLVWRIGSRSNADPRSSTVKNSTFFSFTLERTKFIGNRWFACQYSRRKQVCCNKKNEPPILHSRSMEETYEVLANRLFSATFSLAYPTSKYLVGIIGSPGAGKSTIANEVVSRVNKLWRKSNSREFVDIAISVPMDGFHLYRWQLDAMEDPDEAHARRGAPWTFDPLGLANSLTTLQNEGQAYFPSFDHGVGDPVEQDIFVTSEHKLVLVEGNYLLLPEGEWKQLATFFNEKWFIDVDIEKAMKRVEQRHILTGKPPEIAKFRVDYNDRPNAKLVYTSRRFADLVISSIDCSMGEKR